MEMIDYSFYKSPKELKSGGIYGIYCIPSNKWYIGQTYWLGRRLRDHYKDLTRGKHKNDHLQRAFDMYGEASFEVKILKECDRADLNYWEKYFIDSYDSSNVERGYNICYFDSAGKHLYTHYFSEKVKSSSSKSFKIGLNDAKVIREMYTVGYQPSVIIKKYRLDKKHVSRILGNQVWIDKEYTKPKEVPALNPEEARTLLEWISNGKSISEIIRDSPIKWCRLNKYLNQIKASRNPKHHCLILNQLTGIYYFSFTEAAISSGISMSVLRNKLIGKHNNDTPFLLLNISNKKTSFYNPIILDKTTGIYYETFRDAAIASQVTPRTITKWLTSQKHLNQTNLILCE